MFRSATFLIVCVLAASVIQLSSAKAIEADEQGKARSASTVTVYATSYYSSATTTTILAKQICATLSPSLTACRRKRDYWLDLPIIISPSGDPDILQQFQPTPVLKVEPTPIAQFRHNSNQAVAGVIDSTLDDSSSMYLRAASPLLLNVFPNVPRPQLIPSAASILSSLLTPDVTVTSTLSSYSSTVSTTIYTAKVSYTLASCIPSGLINFSTC